MKAKQPPYTPGISRVMVREGGMSDREGLVTDLKYVESLDIWDVSVEYDDGTLQHVPAQYVAGRFAR